MTYFSNFPQIAYRFGDEISRAIFQNVTAYVDIIDNVKDNQSFFQFYEIQNERPDQVSYKLYNNPDYHWTFFLLNDNIRRSGWPLDNNQVLERALKRYPNTVITTRSPLVTGFNPGDTIRGLSSATTGTILRKIPDLGQLVVSLSSGEIRNGEQIISGSNNLIVNSHSDEYLAAAHYVNGDNIITDFDPYVGPGLLLTEVTNYDLMIQENEELKRIKVLKPNSILSIVSAFEQSLTTDP